MGVQQSRGWQHYAIHRPEPHVLLFKCVPIGAGRRQSWARQLRPLRGRMAALRPPRRASLGRLGRVVRLGGCGGEPGAGRVQRRFSGSVSGVLPAITCRHPPTAVPAPCALQSRAGWLVGAGCGQARPPPPRFAPHHPGRPLTPPARALPLPPPQATAELPGAGAAERGEPSMTVRRPGTPRWGCVPVRVPLAVWPTRLAPPGQPRRYVGMGNGSSAPHAQPGSP